MKKLLFSVLLFSGFVQAQEQKEYVPTNMPSFSWLEQSYLTTRVDFLYWNAYESGLDFVYTDAFNSGNFFGGQGDIERTTFDWHMGFRVGLGYNFQPDYWRIELDYNNFNPNGYKNQSTLNNQVLAGTFPEYTITNLAKAFSHISLRTHIGDLYLSKAFQISRNINLSFLSGIRGIWFKQNWEVTYEGQQPGGYREVIKPKWRFKGFGLRAGMNVDWQCGKGINWTAMTALAAIYGNYDNRMRLYREDFVTLDRLTFQNTHYDDFRIVENVQLAMGPSYEKAFKHWGLKAAALYEMNLFFNVHQVDRDEFYNTVNHNAQTRTVNAMLQMHGVTVQLQASF